MSGNENTNYKGLYSHQDEAAVARKTEWQGHPQGGTYCCCRPKNNHLLPFRQSHSTTRTASATRPSRRLPSDLRKSNPPLRFNTQAVRNTHQPTPDPEKNSSDRFPQLADRHHPHRSPIPGFYCRIPRRSKQHHGHGNRVNYLPMYLAIQ